MPQHDLPDAVNQVNPGAIRSPAPDAFPVDHIPIPDRWRLSETLGLVRTRWWDPYNQNTLKGDRPLCVTADEERGAPQARSAAALHRAPVLEGNDWFFVANAVSDSVVEPRSFPIPVGVQTTELAGEHDVFGRDDSLVASQTFILGCVADQRLDGVHAAGHRISGHAGVQRQLRRRARAARAQRPPVAATATASTHSLGVQEPFID